MVRCFESARGDTFAALPEPLRRSLMGQQRSAFEHLVATTPNVLDRVVLQAGVPVGRVVESRMTAEWWLVDIAFLHEARGQGAGSAVLHGILGEARSAGVGVRLHVRLGHRAQAWYARHGFIAVGRDEQDVEMRAL